MTHPAPKLSTLRLVLMVVLTIEAGAFLAVPFAVGTGMHPVHVWISELGPDSDTFTTTPSTSVLLLMFLANVGVQGFGALTLLIGTHFV